MRNNEPKNLFYFITFDLDSGFPGLHGWTNNYVMLTSYFHQWTNLSPVIYQYWTDSNSIVAEDVQLFIDDNIGIHMDDGDKLVTSDITPFGYNDGNELFISTLSQVQSFEEGYSGIESECSELLTSSIMMFKMISQYIKIEPLKDIIDYIYNIFLKRFIVAINMDISILPDEARRKIGLRNNDEYDYYCMDELFNMDYIIMKAIMNYNGMATKTSKIGWDKDE